MIWNVLAASEVTTASKQPRRSCLTSDFKSVTSITYVAMSLDALTCPILLIRGGETRFSMTPPPPPSEKDKSLT